MSSCLQVGVDAGMGKRRRLNRAGKGHVSCIYTSIFLLDVAISS